MLDRGIAQQPRAQHDEALEQYGAVALEGAPEAPVAVADAGDDDREHEEGAEEGVEEKHAEHVVALERELFHHVIESQTECRDRCQKYPHQAVRVCARSLSSAAAGAMRLAMTTALVM